MRAANQKRKSKRRSVTRTIRDKEKRNSRKKNRLSHLLFGTEGDETLLKRSFGEIDDQDDDDLLLPPRKKTDNNTFQIRFISLAGDMTSFIVSPTTTIESIIEKLAEHHNVYVYEIKVTREHTNTIIQSGTIVDLGIQENELFYYLIDKATGLRRFLGEAVAKIHDSTKIYITCDRWNFWQKTTLNGRGIIHIENDKQDHNYMMTGFLVGPRLKTISCDESKMMISDSDPLKDPVIEFDDEDNIQVVYTFHIWDISNENFALWERLQTIKIELPEAFYLVFSPDFKYFTYVDDDDVIHVGEVPQENQIVVLPRDLLNKQSVYAEGENESKYVDAFSFDNTLCVTTGEFQLPSLVTDPLQRKVIQRRMFLTHIPRGIHINMSVTTPNENNFVAFLHTSNKALMGTLATQTEQTISSDKNKNVSFTYFLLDLTTFTNESFDVSQHSIKLLKDGKSPITDRMNFQCITSDDTYAIFLVSKNEDNSLFALDLIRENHFYLPFNAEPVPGTYFNEVWRTRAVSVSNNQLKLSTPKKLYSIPANP